MVLAAVSFGGAASAYAPGEHPVIGLDHSSGPIGDSVVVTGSGFSHNSSASLAFHSAAVGLGTVSTSSTGTFVITVTVPDGEASGLHTISATDGVTGKIASAAFTVTTGSGAGGTGGGQGGGGGSLAGTGVAVLTIASLGLVLLVGGGLMLLAGRRRKVVA